MKLWKILTLGLALALLLTPFAALAEDTEVTVSGTGVINIKPDTATIMLGVSETAQGAVEAQATVNEKIAAVKEALTGAGAKDRDISVSDLSVWGNYDYSGDTQKLTGYTASHTLNITTADMDAVGPLIDAALGAGANQLQGVSFTAENNDAAYDQALKLAFEKAREKAEVLAAAAGMKLGALESLAEGSVDSYGPYINAKYAVEDGAGQGAPTQVDTGLVTVSATVTAVFEMKG